MNRANKLLTLPFSRLGSLAVASVLLAIARYKLASQPIFQLIHEIGTPLNSHGPDNPKLAIEVAWALQTAASHVPWRADCLVRAIAARQWAERSGLRFVFHLGVYVDTTGNLNAHAWTLSGNTFLSGSGPDLGRFTEFNLEQLPPARLQFLS